MSTPSTPSTRSTRSAPPGRPPGPGTAGFWVGGLMLLAAGIVLAVFGVRLLGIATTGADALVPGRRPAPSARLPPGEERMLFRRDAIEEVPDCRVGPPKGPGRSLEELWWSVRTEARGGTWNAFGRFGAGDGQVVLQCSSGMPLRVRVGLPVGFGDVFGPVGVLVVAPAVLGLGGLVLVVLTALRRSTPRPGRPVS